MSTITFVLNIFQGISIALCCYSIVASWRGHKRHMKNIDKLSEDMMTRYKKHGAWTKIQFNNLVSETNERIRVLAKENEKLREQNDKMRDKLKNLGFTEIDLEK